MFSPQSSDTRFRAGRVRTVLPGILVGQINPSGARPVRPRARSWASVGKRSTSATRRIVRRIETICRHDRIKVAMLAAVVAFAVVAGVLASGLVAS